MRPGVLRSSVLAVLFLAGCATVPYTNRHQLNLIPEGEEDQLGAQAYAEVKAKSKIAADPETNALVRRIGQRIAKAANKPDYKWEFIVIDDAKTVNAFCLPGGRVAV